MFHFIGAIALIPLPGGQQLIFTAGPASAHADAVLPPVVVEVVDSTGSPVATAAGTIRVQVAEGSGAGQLLGTLERPLVLGRATFEDLQVPIAGDAYVMTAHWRGTQQVTSKPFDVAPGAPTQLQFLGVPSGAAHEPLQGISVLVSDLFGNTVLEPTSVSLTLAENPGITLLHASGTFNHVLELVDPITPALLPPLPDQSAANLSSLALDPHSGLVFATDIVEGMHVLNPATGAIAPVAPSGTLPINMKGLVCTPRTDTLMYGVSSQSNILYAISSETGVPTPLIPMVPPGDAIEGFNGLTVDPASGQMFGVANIFSVGESNRALVRLDPSNGLATLVGFMGDKVAGVVATPDGRLYAWTGQGSIQKKKLYRVNPSTGAMTLLLNMGNGDTSEAMCYLPARLGGQISAVSQQGIATFPTVTLNAPAQGYRFLASAAGATPTLSEPFSVTPPNLTGVVQVSSTSQSISESVGTVQVSFKISPVVNHPVVAWVRITGSTSGSNQLFPDHSLPNFVDVPVHFSPGAATAMLSFQVNDDTDVEPAETVIITINRAALGAVGAAKTHTVTITNND